MKNLIRNCACLLFAFLLMADISLAQSNKAKEPNEKDIHIQHLDSVINAHPDSLAALRDYIWTAGLSDTTLQKNYQAWLQKYPTTINIPLALGEAYFQKEMPEAAEYLLKVVTLDSTRAEIWYKLAVTTSIAGDKARANEYYKKAAILKPNNSDYAFYYAYSFETLDTTQFRSKLFDVATHFPGKVRAAQALYWLAEKSSDTLTRINIYEQLYKQFKIKNEWAIYGANELYELYLQTTPQKALAMCDDNNWTARKAQAEQLIIINNLIAQKNYRQALAQIDSVYHIKNLLPIYSLLYKKAQLYSLTGNGRIAYDSLLVQMADNPTYKLRDILLTYGAKIGKTESDLNADVWKHLEKKAVIAPVFSSKLFTEDRRVSLRDYRGKVVLLTFWFPACGPCRAEFPHFEKVMKKFDRQQVAYLGVNGFPEQDGNVLKVMANDKLTFTPLHGSQFMAQNLYNFNGYPSNYLIDQQGRIIYSNFQINKDSEGTLELMINELLNNGTALPARLMADTMKHK
jgi:thiol-disulfide isomerase/thioredoxin